MERALWHARSEMDSVQMACRWWWWQLNLKRCQLSSWADALTLLRFDDWSMQHWKLPDLCLTPLRRVSKTKYIQICVDGLQLFNFFFCRVFSVGSHFQFLIVMECAPDNMVGRIIDWATITARVGLLFLLASQCKAEWGKSIESMACVRNSKTLWCSYRTPARDPVQWERWWSHGNGNARATATT